MHGRLSQQSFYSSPSVFPEDSARDSRPSISAAKYKLSNRTDQQAKLFPALEEEIATRRQKLLSPVRDQYSAQFKDDICAQAKQLKLCPDKYYDEFCQRILRPFSDRFWDEGCAAPAIKGFKASIKLKPGARVPFRQPYHLSKFDETRLSYLYEEAEKEGKVEKLELGDDPPPVCTPVFMVDKKGRRVVAD